MYSGWLLTHVKRSFHTKSRDNFSIWRDLFISGKSLAEVIKEIDLPACVIARILLSHYLTHIHQSELQETKPESQLKKEITQLLRDPNKIYNLQLREVVQEAIRIDPHFSPSGNLLKQSYGEKQETLIEGWLKQNQLSFHNEMDLRRQGFPKTPDFVLLIPVAFYFPKSQSYRVVNWIESKGMFGNENQHKKYSGEQFLSYHNRFGPGLVIYWGGFIEELELLDSSIYLAYEMPEKFIKLKSKYLQES